jgi:hypothetical protein
MRNTRYFTYISDAKVDMILGQIPAGVQEKVSAKLGFDFVVLKGEIGSEAQTLQTRVARLGVLEDHIRSNEPLGSPDAPAKWIAGEAFASSMDVGEGCLLFIAHTKSGILALAGSAKHLAAGAAPTAVSVTFSFFPSIAKTLVGLVDRYPKQLIAIPESKNVRRLAPGISQGARAWTEAIVWCGGRHEQVPQGKIGFLAKRLAEDDYTGIKTVLASPLYVETFE